MAFERVSIVIVDDHVVVREGLRAVLGRQPDFDVIGEAGNAAGALRVISDLQPDVAVLDLRLDRHLPFDALRRICEARSHCRIVAYTAYGGPEHVCTAVAAGVHGYVLKDGTSSELAAAIRAVHRGRRYLSPEVAGHLAENHHATGLTGREMEVLTLMAQGGKNKVIAEQLRIGPETVKSHVQKILSKFGAQTRTEAVRKAVLRGIVAMD